MHAGSQLELYLIIFRLSSNKTFQVCWWLVLGQAMADLFKHTVCSISQVFLSGQIFAPYCNGPVTITLIIKISLCLFCSPIQADVKSIPSGIKSLIGFTCLINLKDGQSITKMQHRDSQSGTSMWGTPKTQESLQKREGAFTVKTNMLLLKDEFEYLLCWLLFLVLLQFHINA